MDSSLYSYTNKWKKRSMNHHNYRTPVLFTSGIFLFCMVFFIVSKVLFYPPTPVFQNSESILDIQCTSFTASGEKFLFYAPHSGFSNQLSEFKNAILMATILNRTLFIPPILDHDAVALGSCPKFRVLSPNEMRFQVWNVNTYIYPGADADDEHKKKKKISFSRKRKDVYKAFGPSSAAGEATVLAFGSLFTAPFKGSESHIDIHKTTKDQRIQRLIQKIEYLPFVPEILNARKKFAHETIKAPFFCVHLRLLDGQFKYHQKATFLGVKQVLDSLIQKGLLPIHMFVMTDLPVRNWSGSYLGELAKDFDYFKLFFLREEDELVAQIASGNFDVKEEQCNVVSLPDVLLFIEETVCSCPTFGFFGTSG